MDETAARRAVLKHCNARYVVADDELVIVDEFTRATPCGWVFFCNSRRYLETGNILHALGENGPIVFESDTGDVVPLPTYGPPDEVIAQYEASRHSRGESPGHRDLPVHLGMSAMSPVLAFNDVTGLDPKMKGPLNIARIKFVSARGRTSSGKPAGRWGVCPSCGESS